jgi:protein tyrosine phosphatase (PTP) superfamily phosphohydrolase (DUF442 family)
MSRYHLAMRQLVAVAAAAVLLVSLANAQAKKETLDGVRNYTVVDATVGCAGATEIRAIPALKERGYKSIVNLRQASEQGAAIDETRAAVTSAGLKFIHLPFNVSAPDESVVDAFLKAVTDPVNQPVFINCGSANRVGGLWLTKRMLVDGWDEAKALEEAKLIGLSNESVQKFALSYVAKRKK